MLVNLVLDMTIIYNYMLRSRKKEEKSRISKTHSVKIPKMSHYRHLIFCIFFTQISAKKSQNILQNRNVTEYLNDDYYEDDYKDDYYDDYEEDNLHFGSAYELDQLENELFNISKEWPYNPNTIPLKGPNFANKKNEKKTKNTRNNKNELINIALQVNLIELINFDTLNEKLEILIEIFLDWHDFRLKWNPNKHAKIDRIDLPYDKVWFPNIGVFNELNGNQRLTTEDNTNKVEVWSSGFMVWEQVNRKSVKCNMRLRNFPFDVQICYVEIRTLTDFGKVQLSLQTFDDNFDVDSRKAKSLNVWSVLSTQLVENHRESILYGIILKRQAKFYITDIIIPCSLLCLLSGLSLFIDSAYR